MFARKSPAQKKVRSTVKSAKRLFNEALDSAEPRLEDAAASLEVLGKDALRAARRASDRGLGEIKAGYGRIEGKVRGVSRKSEKRVRRNPTKVALVTAGLVALTIGLLR
jgi:hypothetical protein